MNNLIKILLIVVSGRAMATNTYRFGYFDQANPSPLKIDAASQWLNEGLRLNGVKAQVMFRVNDLSPSSTDDQLKASDFLILRADLASSKAMASRYLGLGGKVVISDRWTKEDLGLENLAVLSLALPIEKRGMPLAAWMTHHYARDQRAGAYLAQIDSDFDKIWFYDFSKLPTFKDWKWTQIDVDVKKSSIDFSAFVNADKILVSARANSELLAVLNASSFKSNVVLAVDPFLEQPSDKSEAFFKKDIMVYYMSTYPKGFTDEARDFERKYKDALASDAVLRDSLVLVGKALGRSDFAVNSPSKFYAALDGLRIHGVTGETFINKGQLLHEVFVVAQRGSERVLDWRSGIVK